MQAMTEAITAKRALTKTPQSDIEAGRTRQTKMTALLGNRHSMVPLDGAPTERLDVRRYRTIMAYPTCDVLVEAVIATRSYANGLEAGFRLLRFAEAQQEHLAPTEFETNMADLYSFLLDMLDRLDQWEAYLEAWEQIRANTDHARRYNPEAALRQPAMAPFVLRRDRDALWVHFLWGTTSRKTVIERKVRAKREGRRLGNLRHHPQDELSDAERRRRLQWVVQSVQHMWSWAAQAEPTG